MTTIASLAREFNAQPYEIAAALDLDRSADDYSETAELDEATANEYREILAIGAADDADRA